MNVPPAEANVPYTQLKEMDDVNPEFPQADVALVIGANDAGIDNRLYTDPKTGMFFSDAKKGLAELKAAVGEFAG